MKLRVTVFAAALLLVAPALASAPQVGGRAYLVQNASTGDVLVARNPMQRVPIASLTKLMTVLVTLDHARLDDVVTVSGRAAAVGESSIYLTRGERLPVRELIEAALIQSANDAAFALAEYVGRGSQGAFVSLMNAKARALGLRDTHFVNPDGLDAYGHYSSARDVTRLAEIAMRDAFIRRTVRAQALRISGGRVLHTWNDLLATFPGLLGVKTGHTSGAGWSQVAAARGRGVTIYATLLGEPSRSARNSDLTQLLAWGLAQYRIVPVIKTSRVYATVQLPYGKRPLQLVAPRRIVRVSRVEHPLVEQVVAAAAVSLPVARGQRLGEVSVFDRGRLIARAPLVARESIERPGLLGRVGWYAKRTFQTAWGWVS